MVAEWDLEPGPSDPRVHCIVASNGFLGWCRDCKQRTLRECCLGRRSERCEEGGLEEEPTDLMHGPNAGRRCRRAPACEAVGTGPQGTALREWQGAQKQLTVKFAITVSVSGAWLPSLVLCSPESSAPGRWQLIWGKTPVVLSSACEEPALSVCSSCFLEEPLAVWL